VTPRDVAIRGQYAKLLDVVSKKAALRALEEDHGIGSDRLIQIIKAGPEFTPRRSEA
jgi:hypothetical protein